MRHERALITLVLVVAAVVGATFSAEAVYRKGKLLWECEFTQADVEKYGLGKDTARKKAMLDGFSHNSNKEKSNAGVGIVL